MSRLVQLLLVGLVIVSIAAIVWIVMVAKKRPAGDSTQSIPIKTAKPVAGTTTATADPAPAAVQRDPALDAKPEVTARLYPRLAPIEKAQMSTVKALPDAAKPVSAITFFQYTSKSASFADPTGKRVDHFIGGEVIRTCDTARGKASFGWFEVRPGEANQPPPGRDVAPQRVYVAMLPLASGQVEYGYASKRDDVEHQFNETWGCGPRVAAAPAQESATPPAAVAKAARK